MATVLITGGTGMIGTALTQALLQKNYSVIVLSRQTHKPQPSLRAERSNETRNLSYAQWNIKDQTIDKDAIAKADYIIHLAGAGVAEKRWSPKRKQEIVDSRVKSGELIVKALKETTNHVKAVLSTSGIGWYGPDSSIPNQHPFTEDDPVYDDFLAQTCKAWEESLEPVTILGKRLGIFRTGMVLSTHGGALKEFLKPVKFGIATIMGSGEQIVSWIHISDLARLYIEAIENEKIKGVYNAVAPNPVSNEKLTLHLAGIKKGKFFVPMHVPAFMLRAVLGEMSVEILKSATVSCQKITEAGFDFSYPSIGQAIKDLVQEKR